MKHVGNWAGCNESRSSHDASLGATVMWSTSSYTQATPTKRPACTWSHSSFADLSNNSITHWLLIVKTSVTASCTICWLFERLVPELTRDVSVQASSLLESIPKMFSQTQHADACVGAAVQASIDTLKVCFCLCICVAYLLSMPDLPGRLWDRLGPSSPGSTC